mmetsp:Transcript_44452/g.141042  ORF Transcript_44452/g.141042 Transcript_44452/m.141042 type:complete len:203 (+) Transcript_44452:98-706(+)
MGLRGPMLRRSTDPISALTGCHAPARGAGRTAHAPGSPTPPLGPLGPQERAGDRRGARRTPPAEPPEALPPPLAGFPRVRPRPRPPTPRPRAPDAPPSFSFFSMAVHACLSTGRRRGRGEGRRRPHSAAVAPPALIEYRALRAAAQSGSDASIATSLATAVVAHLAAALGAVSSLRRSTPCEVAGGRNSAAVAPPAQPSIGR